MWSPIRQSILHPLITAVKINYSVQTGQPLTGTWDFQTTQVMVTVRAVCCGKHKKIQYRDVSKLLPKNHSIFSYKLLYFHTADLVIQTTTGEKRTSSNWATFCSHVATTAHKLGIHSITDVSQANL
jgi:hypothetical protein